MTSPYLDFRIQVKNNFTYVRPRSGSQSPDSLLDRLLEVIPLCGKLSYVEHLITNFKKIYKSKFCWEEDEVYSELISWNVHTTKVIL